MALVHGLDANLSIGGVQYEGYLDNVDFVMAREQAESKPLGAAAVTTILGIRSFTFTLSGDYDATFDAAVYALWNGEVTGEVIFSPDGDTTTYTVACVCNQSQITAASTALVKQSVNLRGSGTCVRA